MSISTLPPGDVTATPQAGSDAGRWAAFQARDPSADGRFVIGVTSTGIFCRPSCPARHPAPERVRFYETPTEARAAGFRPCLRCHPEGRRVLPADLVLVRAAARLLDESEGPLPLARLARRLAVSPARLEATFLRLTGVTPRQYGDARRLARFKDAVRGGDTVTDALYSAGYGSSSRLYERAHQLLGMTPATYGRGGLGMRLRFATVASPAGLLLVAVTPRGISSVMLGDDPAVLEATLRAEYPRAGITHDPAGLAPWLAEVVAGIDGARPLVELPVDVRATAFQRRVWEALRRIPRGETRSYSEVARSLGHPRAVRAVAHACAVNPVALVVPCHRVVRGDGSLAGYRWGIERKRVLLDRESEQQADTAATAGEQVTG
jgi:AraC family transcriptional regulator, regulatory protein of adaptative response / methylated-DNA-[protein]-cysteine methyltransferase